MSSEEDCLDKCGQLKNCTFSSWDSSKKICTILTELNGNPENPKYFCQKDGAKVMRKEVLCKPVSDVLTESWSALRIKTLKDSTIIKAVKNLFHLFIRELYKFKTHFLNLLINLIKI